MKLNLAKAEYQKNTKITTTGLVKAKVRAVIISNDKKYASRKIGIGYGLTETEAIAKAMIDFDKKVRSN